MSNNFLLDEAMKLNADGVVFHSIGVTLEDIIQGKGSIISQYTINELKSVTFYPKSGRTYYKIIDNVMMPVY